VKFIVKVIAEIIFNRKRRAKENCWGTK